MLRLIGVLAFTSLVLLSISCGDKPVPTNAPTPLTDDQQVLRIALAHFIKQDLWLWNGGEDGTMVVVHPETNGPSFYISRTQVEVDLNERTNKNLTALIDDLQARNSEIRDLPQIDESDISIIVASFENRDEYDDFAAIREKYRDARAIARAWLPGYSPDKSRAIVRFFFGPTAHGATATYILERTETGWEIVRHDFSYYV